MKITKASMMRFSVVSSPKLLAPKSTSQSSAMGEAFSPSLPLSLSLPEG